MEKVIDFETTKIPRHLPWIKGAKAVSVSIECNGKTKTIFLDTEEGIEEFAEELRTATRLRAHNAKFELLWIIGLGLYDIIKDTPIYCTMVAEYFIRRQRRLDGLRLNDLGEHYGLGHKIDKVKLLWESGLDTDEIPRATLAEYGEQDCLLCKAVFLKQIELIKQMNLVKILTNEMEFLHVLAEMEYNGMMLDIPLIRDFESDAIQRIDEIDQEVYKQLGQINIGSGDQLSCALFGGVLEIDGYETITKQYKYGPKEVTRRCKIEQKIQGIGILPNKLYALKKQGMYSVSADALKMCKCRTKEQKRIIDLLLERAKLETLLSTFYKPLQERAGDDGIVHSTINQTITATSRTSSSKPNLQNTPRGSNSPIKQAFITRY